MLRPNYQLESVGDEKRRCDFECRASFRKILDRASNRATGTKINNASPQDAPTWCYATVTHGAFIGPIAESSVN